MAAYSQTTFTHSVIFTSIHGQTKAELKQNNKSPSPLQLYRSQNNLFGLNMDRNYALKAAEALQS